jgi:hypothetical protein
LPLPGPAGKGIATLAQVRKQPEVLAQLKVSDQLPYPVTAEQARAAEAQLVLPLSALSPRMHYLQEKLRSQEKVQAPSISIRVAVAPAQEWERVKAACAEGADKPTPVQVPRERTTLLRRFLPPEEGGADTTHWKQRFTLDLVPWAALPSVFRDERKFPSQSDLGGRIRSLFATPFIMSTMEPQQPRDLLVRGRYSSAVPVLVSEQERWRHHMEQLANASNLQEQADKWFENAVHVYAAQLTAKSPEERQQAEKGMKLLWDDKQAWPIYLLLFSSAAPVRSMEVAYQLGLCSHEPAEQLQARLDVQAQAGITSPHPLDVEKTKQAWQTALNAWKRLQDDYPNHPAIASARRLRARAEAMLGDHKAAIASWKDLFGCRDDWEKIASLYLAQQQEKKQTGKE